MNSQKKPQRLMDIERQIADYDLYADSFVTRDTTIGNSSPQDACSASYGEPVPLVDLSNMSFPWFKVFACWLQKISVPKLTFDFKNSQ